MVDKGLIPAATSCSVKGFPTNNGCSPPNMLYAISTHKFSSTCDENMTITEHLNMSLTCPLTLDDSIISDSTQEQAFNYAKKQNNGSLHFILHCGLAFKIHYKHGKLHD